MKASKYVLFALLLVCLPASAADITLYLGPDLTLAKPGPYYRVTIVNNNGKLELKQEVIFTIENNVPGPGPGPGPITDFDSGVKALFAQVQDADKKVTASAVVTCYKNASLAANTLNNVGDLRKLALMFLEAQLKVTNKWTAWQPFALGVDALVANMTLTQTVDAYGRMTALLQVTDPDPPVPTTAVVSAIILAESEKATPETARLLQELRNDASWSKLIQLVDPNLKNEKGQLNPLAAKAVQKAGALPLPRLQFIDKNGVIGGDEILPATWAATKLRLIAKGLKP